MIKDVMDQKAGLLLVPLPLEIRLVRALTRIIADPLISPRGCRSQYCF